MIKTEKSKIQEEIKLGRKKIRKPLHLSYTMPQQQQRRSQNQRDNRSRSVQLPSFLKCENLYVQSIKSKKKTDNHEKTNNNPKEIRKRKQTQILHQIYHTQEHHIFQTIFWFGR